MPGDGNSDGLLDVADAVLILFHLFTDAGLPLPCGDGTAADPANIALLDQDGAGGMSMTDAVRILAFLFLDGPSSQLGTACVEIPGCVGEVCGEA